jgi:hypothetical protein
MRYYSIEDREADLKLMAQQVDAEFHKVLGANFAPKYMVVLAVNQIIEVSPYEDEGTWDDRHITEACQEVILSALEYYDEVVRGNK